MIADRAAGGRKGNGAECVKCIVPLVPLAACRGMSEYWRTLANYCRDFRKESLALLYSMGIIILTH